MIRAADKKYKTKASTGKRKMSFKMEKPSRKAIEKDKKRMSLIRLASRRKRVPCAVAMERVNRIVDRCGTRIDPAIKDLVAALNMHGIRTVSSCGGHYHQNTRVPWIRFRLEDLWLVNKLVSRQMARAFNTKGNNKNIWCICGDVLVPMNNRRSVQVLRNNASEFAANLIRQF